jgi:hypothetical protein
MKRNIAIVLVILALGGMSGCQWMGRTAGKAQAAIEEGARNTEKGYHEGYGKEKQAPAQSSEQPSGQSSGQGAVDTGREV